MKTINKILVVLDTYEEFSAEEGRLPIEVAKALQLVTDKQNAQILLLSCGYEKFLHSNYYSLGDELKIMREEHCKRLEEKLNSVVNQVKERGYQIDSELVWGYPRYEQIAIKAIDFSADLVVQHTRSYSKLARTFLTNDSWQLVRYCPKPLLLVKDRQWQSTPVVLAAVDPVHNHHKPLKLDNKIIESALGIQRDIGGELHVVHAYAEAGHPFALPAKVMDEHKAAFEELLAEFTISKVNCHMVDETPVIALQACEAQCNSDIIVMGALSRSRLSDALIGNTAERVLDYLESDVLIVKPQSVS